MREEAPRPGSGAPASGRTLPAALGLLVLAAAVALAAGAAAHPAQGAPPWATGDAEGGELRVTVVTVGPNPSSMTGAFGHTAVVVEDRLRDEARFYNYGTFEGSRLELAGLVSGHASVSVSSQGPGTMLALYEDRGREVRFQILDLAPEHRLELASKLHENATAEDAGYRYHWVYDNCTTRVRDLLDEVLDGELSNQTTGTTNLTVREDTWVRLAEQPVKLFLANLLVDGWIDRPLSAWEATYLPHEFEAALANTTYTTPDGTTRDLVRFERTYVEADVDAPTQPRGLTGDGLAAGLAGAALVLGAGLASRRHRLGRRALEAATALVGLAVGAAGTLLLGLGLFAAAYVHLSNPNLLAANPLALGLAGLAVQHARGRAGAQPRLFTLSLALLGLGLVELAALPWAPWVAPTLAAVLPVQAALVLAWAIAPARLAERDAA